METQFLPNNLGDIYFLLCYEEVSLFYIYNPMEAGRTAISFEINDGENQDILSDAGFANAVYQTLRLTVGGACHHAPVCSSWVWVYFSIEKEWSYVFVLFTFPSYKWCWFGRNIELCKGSFLPSFYNAI